VTVLVAGIGNMLMSDDGFGVEVVRRLIAPDAQALPPDVEVVDIGIRGMHLAYQLLDGYDGLLLIDACERGGEPGELYLLEHDLTVAAGAVADDVAVGVPDAHGMTPDAVLALLASLATASGMEPTAGLRRVLVLGCEPASIDDGIGLSGPVTAALPRAVTAVHKVLAEHLTWQPAEQMAGNADDSATSGR
jgi:hydrogenase maturation protease